MKELNADIQDLANAEEIFKDAAPTLFENGFERTAKERTEAVKLLKGPRAPQSHQFTSCLFRQTPPSYPQSGGTYQSFQGEKTVSSLSLEKEKNFQKIQPK